MIPAWRSAGLAASSPKAREPQRRLGVALSDSYARQGHRDGPVRAANTTNLAIGYATAPVGPRYEICEHDWDYGINVGWPHAMDGSRALGILERVPMEELSERKVRYFGC